MDHVAASRDKLSSPKKTGNFTGEVFGESKLATTDVMMNQVLFTPSARTHWHSHESGQILSVVAGQGYVGTRDGQVVKVSAGDTIWTPPGEVHYHGATQESFLLHDAVSLGHIQWLDMVEDEEYGQAGNE